MESGGKRDRLNAINFVRSRVIGRKSRGRIGFLDFDDSELTMIAGPYIPVAVSEESGSFPGSQRDRSLNRAASR